MFKLNIMVPDAGESSLKKLLNRARGIHATLFCALPVSIQKHARPCNACASANLI